MMVGRLSPLIPILFPTGRLIFMAAQVIHHGLLTLIILEAELTGMWSLTIMPPILKTSPMELGILHGQKLAGTVDLARVYLLIQPSTPAFLKLITYLVLFMAGETGISLIALL